MNVRPFHLYWGSVLGDAEALYNPLPPDFLSLMRQTVSEEILIRCQSQILGGTKFDFSFPPPHSLTPIRTKRKRDTLAHQDNPKTVSLQEKGAKRFLGGDPHSFDSDKKTEDEEDFLSDEDEAEDIKVPELSVCLFKGGGL